MRLELLSNSWFAGLYVGLSCCHCLSLTKEEIHANIKLKTECKSSSGSFFLLCPATTTQATNNKIVICLTNFHFVIIDNVDDDDEKISCILFNSISYYCCCCCISLSLSPSLSLLLGFAAVRFFKKNSIYFHIYLSLASWLFCGEYSVALCFTHTLTLGERAKQAVFWKWKAHLHRQKDRDRHLDRCLVYIQTRVQQICIYVIRFGNLKCVSSHKK